MPHNKNVENQDLSPNDLVFILAIAGRIDAQSRILAQKLDKERHVYYAYAALDSLSSSYSMFKYFFDVFISNNPDKMHDIMMTPGGIIAISAESLFLVGFSLLACRFDGEKHDEIKKFIAAAWPYFRDVIKGLKNAYKGWRSAMTAIGVLSGHDYTFLIVPVGLILGIFAAANRLWLRYMVENRKVMMGANAALLIEIKQLDYLSHQDYVYYLKRIQSQENSERYKAFAAVAAGGFIDGLYLYVGVLSLAALSNPLFLAMAIVCGVFTLACMITRVYEEYDFQVRLFVTQTKCQLLLLSKELETSYAQLLLLKKNLKLSEEDVFELNDLQISILHLITQFEVTRELLEHQTSRSYLTAGLLGLKNGLYAYSALASILFLIGSIFVMSSAAFPPVLLIFSVGLGLAFMVGFIAHALRANYLNNNKPKNTSERPYEKIIEIKEHIKQDKKESFLEIDEFKESLKDGLFLDPSPQYFFQEWFEVVRSFFSGVGKGQKFVDFAGNPLQEADNQGHYHDTPIMYVLAGFSAALFSIILALRALARGLGRPPLGQVDLTKDVEQTDEIDEAHETEIEMALQTPAKKIIGLETQMVKESSPTVKVRADSLGRSKSSAALSHYSFLEELKHLNTKPTLPHSSSNASLPTDESMNIIQGLA